MIKNVMVKGTEMTKWKHGFDRTTGNGQKRLMAKSRGLDPETYIAKTVDVLAKCDYGCDPVGDGTFKMVPSGDIVDLKEMGSAWVDLKRSSGMGELLWQRMV